MYKDLKKKTPKAYARKICRFKFTVDVSWNVHINSRFKRLKIYLLESFLFWTNLN